MGEELEEQMEKEGLTAIIGVRVFPSMKKYLQEEATAREQTLSSLIFDFIIAGLDKMEAEDNVKQEGSEKG